MAAVDEQDAIAALGQPLEMLLLRLVAGPEEAEIPQHDERVAFFQLFDGFVGKTLDVAMEIAGHINHGGTHLFHTKSLYKQAQNCYNI